jgi:hypothetical protein
MRRKIFLMLAICVSAFVFSTTALAQQKFTASLNGPQEVPPVNSPGRGSCVITLNTAETQFTVSCTYSGLTTNVVGGHIHDNGPVGVNGPVRFNFNLTGGTSGTVGPLTFAVTPAQVADLRAHRWYANIHTTQFTGGEIRGQVKQATQPFDFDGDGRTDIRVFRLNAGTFYTLNSINNSVSTNFFAGASGTINSASDDYDGDGRGDLVTFVNQGTARLWRILQTGTNTVREVYWGLTTDQVLPADYDGDGKTDVAVFRRTDGVWYIIRSSDNQMRAEIYGAVNDFGMVGDFDKDGINDLTVIRGTASGIGWFTRRSSDGMTQVVLWGGPPAPGGDFIFPAVQVDIDGDGRQDHMIARDPDTATMGDTMTYYIRRSSDGQAFVLPWGLDTDSRLFGDYDGDGRTDLVARRTLNGLFVWYIYQSSNGQGRAVTFGQAGDLRPGEHSDILNGEEISEFEVKF